MAQTLRFPQKVRGNFISGDFSIPAEVSGDFSLKSPADIEDVVGQFKYSFTDIDRAVSGAREAFKNWRKTSFEDRAAILKKYGEALKRREDELVEVIAREVGKPLWEAKTEVGAMINKISITLNESMKEIQGFTAAGILPDTTGVCTYRPLGVVAVIGPFNFPGHLPNGHIMPALATGNCVIFKPSEKTPLTGQLMAESLAEAGIPKGVFSLVQGEKEVGRRLCVHEGVDGILFTGSYEVGVRIKQDTLQQHWKLTALEMGGKNAAIVWDDASLEVALLECLVGAFITCGQRCSATSRAIVHRKWADEFVEKFHKRAKSFSINHPFKNPFMGPLIDQGSVDRYQKFQGIAQREGYELVMRGKSLDLEVEGNYVTPSIGYLKKSNLEAVKKSVYQQTEMFAPNISIVGVDTFEEAITYANATQYGLVASVFTGSRETYEKFCDELETGLVNWNRSTVGASSKLPFGGTKKSGNHFPTALPSTRYCTYPVGILEVEKPAAPDAAKLATTYPGLLWE